MNQWDRALSTSASVNDFQQDEKIRKAEKFILERIKFQQGTEKYDMLNRKDFNRLLDHLSFKGRGILCENNLKNQVFFECQKISGRVTVDNIVKIVAKKLHDPSTSQEKRQKLNLIFINSSPTKSGLKNVQMLDYFFGGFGICALTFSIFQKVGIKMSCLLQGRISSIIQAYFSSGVIYPASIFSCVHRDPGLNISVLRSIQRNNLGMDLIQGAHQIPIEGDNKARQGIGMAGKFLQGMGGKMWKGVKLVRDFLIGIFFERDDVQKTTKLSLGNTLVSCIFILLSGYLIYSVLKGHGSKKRKDDSMQTPKDTYSL